MNFLLTVCAAPALKPLPYPYLTIFLLHKMTDFSFLVFTIFTNWDPFPRVILSSKIIDNTIFFNINEMGPTFGDFFFVVVDKNGTYVQGFLVKN